MKKNKKTILNISITLICIAAIYYYIFSKHNITVIESYLKGINYKWLTYALLCILIYVFTDIVILYLMTKRLYEKVSVGLVSKAVMGLYVFNNITPFFTGGFPYQLYLYNKGGIPISKTSNIIITRNILYQLVLILFSIIALNYLPNHDKNLIILLIFINILAQIVGIAFQLFAMFKPKWCKKVSKFIIKYLVKIKVIRNYESINNKVNKQIDDFARCNQEIIKNRFFILKLILVQIVSFFFLFLCVFYIFKGFSIECNTLSIVFMVSCIYLFGFVIPTPGGTGGIEGTFILLFKNVASSEIIISIMLVWRFISCYLLILLGSLSFLYKPKDLLAKQTIK